MQYLDLMALLPKLNGSNTYTKMDLKIFIIILFDIRMDLELCWLKIAQQCILGRYKAILANLFKYDLRRASDGLISKL